MSHANKEEERAHLMRFIAARKAAIGEKLTLHQSHESPDFLCMRPDGTIVGVEHTKVAYSPTAAEHRLAVGEPEPVDLFDALAEAFNAVTKKEAKRVKPHWTLPNATILVLDLVEGAVDGRWPDDDGYSKDFSDCGFLEVWLADHSSIEAYGAITLIGLYPTSIWGIQGQGYLWGKPYG